MTELGNRFDEKNLVIMNGVSACTPSSSAFLSLDDLSRFAEAYGVDINGLEVECSLLKIQMQSHSNVAFLVEFSSLRLPAHQTVTELVQIALTIAQRVRDRFPP